MNNQQDWLLGGLLSLADEKISCLQALNAGLHLFYDTMEVSDQTEILSQLELQSALMEQINCIDEKYKAMQKANFSNDSPAALDLKLKEQKELLTELSCLNKKAKERAQALSSTFKQKIKTVEQQSSILSNYNLFDKNQTGNLYDYKEGKRP